MENYYDYVYNGIRNDLKQLFIIIIIQWKDNFRLSIRYIQSSNNFDLAFLSLLFRFLGLATYIIVVIL